MLTPHPPDTRIRRSQRPSGVALILDIDLKLLEQPSVEDEKCQFYSRLPTVTECESSELHDVLACVFLPARSTALHPHFEQTFTGCFDVASTKRQTKCAHGHNLRSMSRMRATPHRTRAR